MRVVANDRLNQPVPTVPSRQGDHRTARRQRVLAALAERPGIRYAVVVDNPDIDPVIVALGIRGAMPDGSFVTCELRVPLTKFDPFLLLDLIARYGGTVH